MHVTTTTNAETRACPRCATEGMVSRFTLHDRHAEEPIAIAGCAACGADLDPDTFTDLGTTYGD